MDDKHLARARDRLLDEIEEEARNTETWTGRARFSQAVMAAMYKVPRHEFVRPEDTAVAYVNRPQPIGHGQTISQPYMVAVMTDLLDLRPEHRVLEIGTGCGYQAAVLAHGGGRIYTMEVIPELAESARKRLKRLGYDTVEVRSGDGFGGWPEEAPFDAIIVTSAPESIPDGLVRQLKPDGRMVIPLGRPDHTQILHVCTLDGDGDLKTRPTLPVAFVPMVPADGNGPG